MPDDVAASVEKSFFKPVDTSAADALLLLEAEGNNAQWDTGRRSAWSRFLHSLLVRCPEDLALYLEQWDGYMSADPNGEWEKQYQQRRRSTDPPTMTDFIASMSEADKSTRAMKTFIGMIDNPSLGQKMNNLLWWTIGTDRARFDLLTSDRPIIRTNGLMRDGGHLALPIGPRRLFVAAKDRDALKAIADLPVDNLVEQVNDYVVRHAVRFVFGRSDVALRYVSRKMSTAVEPRLMTSVMAKALVDTDPSRE